MQLQGSEHLASQTEGAEGLTKALEHPVGAGGKCVTEHTCLLHKGRRQEALP